MARVLVAVSLVVLTAGVQRGQRRDVATSQGTVRGYRAGGPAPHFVFLGIPYGGGAGGARGRFKAPTVPRRWDGVFEATPRVRCPQVGAGGVESCLVANVFVPEAQAAMPVVVYFHGGGFHSGWGPHEPPQRLIKQGIIVVTFNYRLGALGFLCLNTDEAPGNAGLKDQVAALYWVQRNIAKFGGDPTEVTLYGTGAGAVAIQLLILTGAAKDLFQRVIMESGSAVSPETIMNDPVLVANKTAVLLGLSANSSLEELTHFYKTLPHSKLANYSSNFRPCIDNQEYHSINLLERDPMEILNSGSFEKVAIMFVYTSLEGLSYITETFEPTKQDLYYLLPNDLEFEDELTKVRIADVTEEFYNGDDKSNDGLLKRYVDYFSDLFVVYPMVKSAIQHATDSSVPVYLMEFSYHGGLSVPKSIEAPGASHGDIYNYIFSKDDLDYDDELVAAKLVTLWSNFIRFGDPTPLTTSLVPIIWQPVSLRSGNPEQKLLSANYLSFSTNLVTRTTSTKLQLVFWERMYTKFYRKFKKIDN